MERKSRRRGGRTAYPVALSHGHPREAGRQGAETGTTEAGSHSVQLQTDDEDTARLLSDKRFCRFAVPASAAEGHTERCWGCCICSMIRCVSQQTFGHRGRKSTGVLLTLCDLHASV